MASALLPENYRPAVETDLPQLAQALSWAFCFPQTESEPWLRRSGLENTRVLVREGRVAACLVLIPMGQCFGGRSVPMVGIAGVATPAELRGSGAALELMRRTVAELHARKVPLSTLYPATRSLYRRVGYEVAGSRMELSVSVRALGAPDRTLQIRTGSEDDEDTIEGLYRARALRNSGHVDRGPYVWHRIRNPRDATPRTFLVGEESRSDGYVILYEKRLPSMNYDVRIADYAARTLGAHRRLLALLADHATLGESVVWYGSPSDPLLQVLPDRHYEARDLQHWMLRLTDVARALEGRGYPAGLTADIELDVEDELAEGNRGRFVLHVAEGRGSVRRGGRGAIRLDVKGFAPLYTGHLTASTLASLGMLDGSEDDVAQTEAIFGAASPWMPDFF